MTFSLYRSIGLIALSTSLVMGACSPKDKGGSPQISAKTASLGLSAPSDKVFKRHFEVPKRKVDNTESEKALAALGLSESGTGELSWDKRTGKNGRYVFTNLKNQSDDGTLIINKAELIGVHMDGDTPTFDRADFSGINISSDDLTINVKTVSLARPTPDTASAIIDNLDDIAHSGDTSINIDTPKDFGFGALSLSAIDLSGDDIRGTIDQIIYGADDTDKIADFKLEDVNLKIGPKEDESKLATLTLESLSALGFKMENMSKSMQVTGLGQNSLGSLFSGMNFYQKPYEEVILKALTFDNANININAQGFEGISKTKGDVVTVTQTGEPFIIKLKEAPNSADAKRLYEIMQKLDFQEMTFLSSQTTILDKSKDSVRIEDGRVEMIDGFDLNYTYGASGLNVMQDALKTDATSTEQQKLLMESLRLDDMKFSLVDKSIVDRGLTLAEEMSGQPRNRIIAGMQAAVTMAQFAAPSQLEKDMATEAGDAMIDFLKKGGTLTIEIDPEQPLPMSELANLQKSGKGLDAIGFSAKQSD